MANPVKWFEIMGTDSAGLQKFYRDVFGWKMTAPVKEMGNYSMLEDHEPGIGGGLGQGDARVTIYVETFDPEGLLERATRSGARVLMPVTTITPDTTIAMLMDPAGNTFGLMKANPRRQSTATKKTTVRKKTTARKKTTTSARKKTTARKTTRRRR